MNFHIKYLAYRQAGKIQNTLYHQDSFTLVEMIVVIAILTILTAAAVVVINPVEWLKQSRDVQRITDLKNIQSIIGKYKYSGNRIGSLGNSNTVYVSLVDASSSSCADLGLPALASGWVYSCVTSTSTLQDVDGTGWIPINISSLGILPSLPIDPSNNATSNLYYSYIVNSSGQFELTATLESQKKLKDTALVDSGTDPAKYEVGETLTLWTQASGLVGYWPFENSLSDNSGLGFNGTWYGTSTSRYVPGKVGFSAGFFNGSSDYVDIPYNQSLSITNSATLSGWIFSTSTSAYQSIVGIQNAHRFLAVGGGNAMNGWWNTSLLDAAYTGYACNYLNGWHYAALTYTSSDGYLRLYCDGLPVGSKYYGGTLAVSTNDTTIGVRSQSLNLYVAGSIDDVRVYSRALSTSEIQNIYNATK